MCSNVLNKMDKKVNGCNQCSRIYKNKRSLTCLLSSAMDKLLWILVFLVFSKLITSCEGQRNSRRHFNNAALAALIDLTKSAKAPVLKLKSNQSDLFIQNIGMPRIPQTELNDIINLAEDEINERFLIIEPAILSSGAIQIPGSQGWFLAASSRTKILAKNYSKSALVAEKASKIIVERYNLNRDQINFALPTTDVRLTSLGQECPRKEISFPCHPAKYRSLSGHCNNVQNPDWGSSLSAYIRYTPAQYADGISAPRSSITGDELPSARDVSYLIHQGSEVEHPHLTTLLAFFGEFVSHDLVHIAQTVGHRGHRIKCCGLDENLQHPECFPINIKRIDPLFRDMKQICLEYVRSCSAIRTGCTLGEREQINQVTSFLDASAIYGSSEEELKTLRKFEGGLLKYQKMVNNGKEKELLPALEGQQDCRSHSIGKNKKCFHAGDIRVNENVGLTLIHTLWLREHNRIARALQALNPHYDDEQIFQEARRIVGAELQHIVYNELLSSILGHEKLMEYDLAPLADGYYNGYDIDANPGIDNAVASQVLSFFYSMIPSRFERYSQRLTMTGTKKMSETYYNPSDLYDYTKFDEYLMGFVSQNAHNIDVFVSNEMTNNIASEANEGFDLVAIILQQGRDHGIPGYTTWRKVCNVEPQINDWDDLQKVFNLSIVKKLSQLYKSVHDIDLFTGGLAESPLRGAIVGQTFTCLLATQFHYLKKGDRHWYENDLPPSSFTKDQLTEIRKSSLARILCDNGDDIAYVQPSSMVISDAYLNSIQYCSNIREMDLSKWKSDEQSFVIPLSIMKEAILRSKRQVRSLVSKTAKAGVKSRKSVPSGAYRGALSSARAKRQTLGISNQSLVLEIVSNNFVRSYLQSNKDREKSRSLKYEIKRLMDSLPNLDIDELFDVHFTEYVRKKEEDCSEKMLPCDHTHPFRTYSGWCNNLKFPDYGNSYKLFNRLLPPTYDDGVSKPRKTAKSGKPLPNARFISTNIHYDISSPHARYALITMQWGQFLDHDITFTPMYLAPDESLLDCKSCDSQKTVHHECWPIPIPKNDPYFPSRDSLGQRQCLNFVRSINAQSKLGRREQFNQLTSFIDASNVYGSEPCDAAMLRTFQSGRLNTTTHPLLDHKDLLPQTNNNPECRAPSRTCFEAGDLRSSEQPGLASMHTVFLRQHNKLANELSLINPHWDDEMLYQTTRKIVSAIAQRITYNEFLPRVLGIDYMNKYGLTLLSSGYYDSYDQDCNPTIMNEFSAAVFRFGHSLIKPSLARLGKAFEVVEKPLRLRSAFFNSDMLYSANAIDNILRGLISNSAETLDNSITEEITNHLFEDKKVPFSGMDLIALNIQRARDHGIPPYNEYRVKCNLTRAFTFDDLSKEIDSNLIERLKLIYESVDDIDLFTGGLSEYPLHGGSVGPTFGCVAGMQFERIKKCDRFWHETSNPFVRFTEAQLNEIRKMTLAKVICDNSDSIDYIQRNVMDLPDSFLNPRVDCLNLPSLDVTKWVDRGDNCLVNGKDIRLGATERITPCTVCVCTKEGPICNSVKVQNCFNLFIMFTKQAIINDPVCKVQCAFALRVLPNESYYHTTNNFN